jgi:hypothetical protein
MKLLQVHPVVIQPRVTSEELLAPEDIKITYSETDPNNSKHGSNKNLMEPETDPEEPMTSAVLDSKASADRNAYNNFEAWNQVYGDEKTNEKVEAPRVLPSTEKQDQGDKIENFQKGNYQGKMQYL